MVVTTTDREADPFKLSAGVLRGDTLAPYLFVLVVDYVLRCAISDASHGFIISPYVSIQSRTSSPAVAVSDLDFADDIALLSHNHGDAQALLTSVEQEALTVGLRINRKKTEYMLVGDFRADPGLTVIEGPIVRTNNFKYLGSRLVSSKSLRFNELKLGRHASGCIGSGSQMCPATSWYIFSSHCRNCSALWSRSMVTGSGESSGQHLHPATKVFPRNQMARSPDQHSSVS